MPIILTLTPVLSSRSLNPSMATWTCMRCLCSPAARMAILRSASASWHILSPRASGTSSTPINFARNDTPSPRKRPDAFLSVKRDIQLECDLKTSDPKLRFFILDFIFSFSQFLSYLDGKSLLVTKYNGCTK